MFPELVTAPRGSEFGEETLELILSPLSSNFTAVGKAKSTTENEDPMAMAWREPFGWIVGTQAADTVTGSSA